jgi:hypothetical protein
VPQRPVVFVNLFNNQWTTNFRLWNQGTWTSRVRIWAVDRYAAEPSLITPALEARYPLLAAAVDGPPGALPATQSGLAVSHKGVLVGAFGANEAGDGKLLRLWEQAGNAWDLEVTVPAGLGLRTAQPTDLRAQPTGKPVDIQNKAFPATLMPFAPQSFVLH